MSNASVSVLMCCYEGNHPRHLAAALNSIINQNRKPDEIVLVEDGPLTQEIRTVIEQARKQNPGLVQSVVMPENRGLVYALNRGLAACSGDIVVRMDTDDVSLPERIERQVGFLEAHPEIGVVGSAMQEFVDSPENPLREKPVKENHDAILRQLPWRNPVNHPTVCYRRNLLPPSGYPDLRYLEDYYLWCVLIDRGVRFANIDEPLVLYRFDDETLARRAGWINFRNEVYLRKWMLQHGQVNRFSFALIFCLQALLRFSPTALQRFLWQRTRRPIT
jgi:glycosyltransferase involved in cell wall biosynthesis